MKKFDCKMLPMNDFATEEKPTLLITTVTNRKSSPSAARPYIFLKYSHRASSTNTPSSIVNGFNLYHDYIIE